MDEVYNKNRDNNNSMRDEIREQNAKLKGAPLKDKWEYFKEYYLKSTLLIAAIVALVIYLVYSMVTAPSDTAFAAFFINDTGDPSSSELQDGFAEYMDIDTKKHECYIDALFDYSVDSTNYEDYMGLEKITAIISAKKLDLIVGDEPVMDYYGQLECLSDVTTILPDDLLSQFEDKLYYIELEETGQTIPVGVYITDAPKIVEYNYYNGKEGIMGFVVNSENTDNAIAFLRYIYTED